MKKITILFKAMRLLAITLLISSVCLMSCSKEKSGQHSGNHPISALNSLSSDSLGVGNLGSAVCIVNSNLKDTATFDPTLENYTTLFVTDANGYGWMLSIPPHALLTNQFITMTAFSSIDVSRSGARIRSGVQLEPDGLQFMDKVMVTVSPPVEKPGIGILFTFNHDGSHVQFAESWNTTGKNAFAWIWHFSCAGYDNSYESGNDVMYLYKKWAEEEYQLSLNAAKLFLKNPAPTPPAVPAISEYCRIFSKDQIDVDLYEFIHYFIEPYKDIWDVVLGSMRILELLDGNVNLDEGYSVCLQLAQMAEKSLWQLGTQYVAETPPDHLYALINVGLQIERLKELFGGDGSIDPQLISWAQTIRDYYLDQLKNKHEYRAFPVLINLNKDAVILGGIDKLDNIMSAMTFEVIVSTSFNSTWKSSDNQVYATGNVEQTADVKDIVNELTPPSYLWGNGNNMTLTSQSGTFTDSKGPVALAGQINTGSLWLLNWDPCITNTFDVMIGGFDIGDNESAKVAGSSSSVSLKDYWWNGAVAFMFTIPMENYNPTLGDATFSGSGQVDNLFTSSSSIHITIKHTPK
jgi:hypothetical protein